jgi:hypothetical protein
MGDRAVNAILPLIIMGLGFYFLLSNKSGKGCSDGRLEHRPREPNKRNSGQDSSEPARATIIDLKREDYKVISIENPSEGLWD